MTTRRIPPPPARYSPTSRTPDSRPQGRITWAGDTRHTVGNITARDRRPVRLPELARIMSAAPAGR